MSRANLTLLRLLQHKKTRKPRLRYHHAHMHTRAHLSWGTCGLATRLFAEIVRLASGSVPNDDIPPTLDQVAGHTVAHDAQPCHRQIDIASETEIYT